MSDNKDFYDLDDILAEFSSYSENIIHSTQPSEEPKTEPVKRPEAPVTESEPAAASAQNYDYSGICDVHANPRKAQPSRVRFDVSRQEMSAYGKSVRPAAERSAVSSERFSAESRRNIQNFREQVSFDPEIMAMKGSAHGPSSGNVRRPAKTHQMSQPKAPRRPAATAAEIKRPAPAARPVKAEKAAASEKRGLFGILGIVFALISLFAFSWIFVNIHPDSGTTVGSALKSKVNMVEKFDSYANNAASDALGELAYIPKIYTIAEDVNVAPKPNPANFGSTTNPQDVMKVIKDAAALIGDQEIAFNPDAKFLPGSEIKYYRDDTILAIAWKEDINGKCCSCSEIKIAHGSQIRRKVAGDTYSVGKRYYATDMAKECNAVVAINGDFYDFRPIGITVFQRELFRFNPGKLDSCHITSGGDFLFSYADELKDEEYTRQFIKDNDVVFSLSFGPIIIDNGELRPISGYPIGEVNTTYSRSAIGMLDELHYMLMTVNYDVGYRTAATLNEIGQFMAAKNCQKAYALDGGQTSVLMMNGELVNHVDYGNERTMSDIIYFATAIPEEEAAK